MSEHFTAIALLVGGFNPSEKYKSLIGMMTFPTERENKSNLPNHQPDYVSPKLFCTKLHPWPETEGPPRIGLRCREEIPLQQPPEYLRKCFSAQKEES